MGDYRAIEVIPGKNCSCDLSKLGGKRILLSDMDRLISQASFYPHCTCTFKHYSDRRSGHDRRNFNLINTLTTYAKVRTRPYGRRSADIHNRSRDRSVAMSDNGAFAS